MAGWQLIETASTLHGAKADLWVPGRGRVTDCVYSKAYNPPTWGHTVYLNAGPWYFKLKPTHWMPIPEQPDD